MTDETTKRTWGAMRKNPTPLHELLAMGFPNLRTRYDDLDFRALGDLVGYSHQGIRQRVVLNRLTPKLAKLVVEASEGRITYEMVFPFMILED